jgi:hypothetical protein
MIPVELLQHGKKGSRMTMTTVTSSPVTVSLAATVDDGNFYLG